MQNSTILELESKVKDNRWLILFIIILPFFTFTYELFNLTISIDDEYTINNLAANKIWLSDGRWGTYFLEALLFRQAIVPFTTLYTSLLSIIISSFIIFSILEKISLKTYISSALIVSFPTLYFIFVFNGNTPAIGAGYLAIAFSSYFFFRGKKYDLLYSILLLGLGISFYQSFITLSISVFLFIILFRILKGEAELNKEFYILCGKYITVLALGLAFYKLAGMFFIYMFNAPKDYKYLDGFVNYTISVEYFMNMFALMGKNIRLFYTGSSNLYAEKLYILASLSVVSLATIVFYTIIKNLTIKHKALSFGILLLLVLSPFFLQGLNPYGIPVRAIVAAPFIMGAMVFIALSLAKHRYISIFIIALSLGTFFQFSTTNNHLAYKNYISLESDKSLTQEIISRINIKADGLEVDKYLFIGEPDSKKRHDYIKHINQTVSMSLYSEDWGLIEQGRIHSMMSLWGLTFPYTYPTLQQQRDIFTKTLLMPLWPHKDSIQIINGIAVVKFSEYTKFQLSQICKKDEFWESGCE